MVPPECSSTADRTERSHAFRCPSRGLSLARAAGKRRQCALTPARAGTAWGLVISLPLREAPGWQWDHVCTQLKPVLQPSPHFCQPSHAFCALISESPPRQPRTQHEGPLHRKSPNSLRGPRASLASPPGRLIPARSRSTIEHRAVLIVPGLGRKKGNSTALPATPKTISRRAVYP
jgi:hypothetical protein